MRLELRQALEPWYVLGEEVTAGGTARFASGLSANDFLRRTSVLRFSREGLEQLADDVRLLADKEGLTAHRASVDVRLGGINHTSARSLWGSGRPTTL